MHLRLLYHFLVTSTNNTVDIYPMLIGSCFYDFPSPQIFTGMLNQSNSNWTDSNRGAGRSWIDFTLQRKWPSQNPLCRIEAYSSSPDLEVHFENSLVWTAEVCWMPARHEIIRKISSRRFFAMQVLKQFCKGKKNRWQSLLFVFHFKWCFFFDLKKSFHCCTCCYTANAIKQLHVDTTITLYQN